MSTDAILIPESRDAHNCLVELVEKTQEFSVPGPCPNGYRIGYVDVKNPKPNHPGNIAGKLPVAYFNYGEFILVNIEETALNEYHYRLRALITGEQKT